MGRPSCFWQVTEQPSSNRFYRKADGVRLHTPHHPKGKHQGSSRERVLLRKGIYITTLFVRVKDGSGSCITEKRFSWAIDSTLTTTHGFQRGHFQNYIKSKVPLGTGCLFPFILYCPHWPVATLSLLGIERRFVLLMVDRICSLIVDGSGRSLLVVLALFLEQNVQRRQITLQTRCYVPSQLLRSALYYIGWYMRWVVELCI